MSEVRKIRKALISVFYKDGIDIVAKKLVESGAELISTGGTYEYIQSLGLPVSKVEDLTGYPSILGGRVKTLHPKIFGGILYRRDNESDIQQCGQYEIPPVDLVVVDLYPFEEYVAAGSDNADIIEKIDIGGISLIRAAAKNYKDVIIVPCKEAYNDLIRLLEEKNGESDIEDRRKFACKAFQTSSAYDTAIFNYFNQDNSVSLRYGENPHQTAKFYGTGLPEQIHGKEISYNNLLDVEAAIELIRDFDAPTVAVIKHNNACGCASRSTMLEAWRDALAGDPVSAFGGIIVANREIDEVVAEEVGRIFFEVIIAPSYTDKAIEILEVKKNRIILIDKDTKLSQKKMRSMLGGVLVQDRDTKAETTEDLKVVTKASPDDAQTADLLFANRIVKHSKSNAIVLAKDGMLLASGIGQTSRVDALKQAIAKARSFNFDLDGAVMASDAFFPFADCVEIAHEAGIKAVIHPGGSIRDNDSVEFCDNNSMAMVMTGFRHFKH